MFNRRDAIKSIIIGGTASLFSPNTLLASTKTKKEKMGIALVGLGYYSTDLLAPALQTTTNCYLAGIVTGTPEKAIKWKQKYNIPDKNIYNYQNFDSIANNPDIDVVYVVLPPSMHKEFVVRAARAGKHVFCEKPMAPSVSDCLAMIKACKDNKVNLAIGYRCQHDPNTQEYMRITREQVYGKVKMISCGAGYFDARTTHWKQNKALGGGVMGDMGVYALQGARLATGEEPIAVTAQASTTRPEIYKEVEETMMFQLQFPSGALAACHTSFGINMNYLQVNYEKGWLKMEPFSAYSDNKGSHSNGVINFPLKSQQAKQLDEDCAAIMNGTTLIAPGEEGLRDIKVVEAIYKAAQNGGTVKI
ncbi:oxidoreductase domain protein [Emticicia oligotrophica DSM 17448]|uniref:Oxidoreductase domain protein n=1 Tax=Emticicia oligotrophica (strain DSM 17448 / CIP 109782 / MTCC 6937 / GPTSA100-15) TaxID=929562 RepID=A0ABM5N4H3_EMTOG|nr:Gfo/Idh/MocA family oxidoreductase [Emticicia oligotrophica]AFK04338.1 oxidoreductase domain protein [Emticicia oligotrophica DSM 17448]